MKKILALFIATAISIGASAATLVPVQLLNPAGSALGQTIVSTGPTSAPSFGTIGYNALPVQIPNSLIGNVSSSTQAPNVVGLPSCASNTNALIYTNGAGFTCNTNINASTLGGQIFAAPGPIGSSVASTGAFTTLSASSTVSGTGFSNYLASPPAIGGTTAAAGTFTVLRATSHVKVFAQNTSAQSIPNNTATRVSTWTALTNVGGAFNAATGIFTAPRAGQYLVSSHVAMASATWPAATAATLQVFQNAASVDENANTLFVSTTGVVRTPTVTTLVNCAAGDTIQITLIQNQGGAVALFSGATTNTLSIVEVP